MNVLTEVIGLSTGTEVQVNAANAAHVPANTYVPMCKADIASDTKFGNCISKMWLSYQQGAL